MKMMTKRLFEWLRKHDNRIIGVGFFSSVLIAFCLLALWPGVGIWDAAFYTLQMVVLNFDKPEAMADEPWLTVFHVVRLAIPVFASWALLKAYMQLAGHTVDRFMARRSANHVVICGNGAQAHMIAAQHLAQQKQGSWRQKPLLIATGALTPELDQLARQGVRVLEADATDSKELAALGVGRAAVVYIVSGPDDTNVRILEALREAKTGKTARRNPQREAVCLIHILDDLLTDRINACTRNWTDQERLCVRPFNAWKEAARRLIVKHGPDLYSPVRKQTDPQPHVLLIGYSWFGEQVVEQLSRLGHFAFGKKARVTIVCPQGSRTCARLLAKFPALDPAPDLQTWGAAFPLLPLIDIRVIDAPTDGFSLSEVLADGAPPISVAYIAAEDATNGFAAANALLLQSLRPAFPVLVCAQQGARALQRFLTVPASPVMLFDALQEGLRLEGEEDFLGQFSEREAALVDLHFFVHHRADDAGETDPSVSLMDNILHGDESQKRKGWRNLERRWNRIAEEWKKESSRDAVRHLTIKQRFIGERRTIADVSDTERSELSRMEHVRWAAERLLTGWRYAALRNNAQALHDDLIPFDALRPKSKAKDLSIIEVSRMIRDFRSTNGSAARADEKHAPVEKFAR